MRARLMEQLKVRAWNHPKRKRRRSKSANLGWMKAMKMVSFVLCKKFE